MNARQQRRIAVWVWVAIPVLLQFLIVMEYRTGLIILDEFRHILPRVQHLLEGNFSLYADVWANQNVHRPVLPILIILANALFAGWNVVYETLIAYGLYVVLLIVVVRQQMRTARDLAFEPLNWTLPVIAFLLFSMTSWKVFYMGYAALQHSFAVLGVVAGLFVLSRSERPWRSLAQAALLGLMATFSFASGLVFWPVGIFVLLCKKMKSRRARFLHIGLWLGITLLVAGLYMHDMQEKSNSASFVHHILRNVEFVLVYLGAPICNYNVTGALMTGLGGLTALGLLVLDLVFRQRIALFTLTPYLALGLFSLGAGFLTSLGRLLYSVDAVLQRDWKIFATPLWIALSVLVYLRLKSAPQERFAASLLDGSPAENPHRHDSSSRPEHGRAGRALDLCIAFGLPAAMAIAMLSFWSTNFVELELYQSRHFPLARLSARLTHRPVPTDIEIPSFRHELSQASKKSLIRAAEKAVRMSEGPVTLKDLRVLHPKEDAAGIAWRLQFLRRHRLSVFRGKKGTQPKKSDEPSASTSPTTERPDVVLISIDTLRRDHLPIYGYARDTSPNLLALSEHSVVFESAITTHTNTAPAHASMLTGEYPGRHGIEDNWSRLRDDVQTLAEVLSGQGYRSAAFVSGLPLSTHTNLQRGFAVYDSPLAPQRQRRAARTWETARRWLDRAVAVEGPFFLFIHFYDPHSSYNPPARLGKQFGQRRRFRKGSVEHVREKYTGPGSKGRVEETISRYDGEIFYADQHVGKLLRRLDEVGRMANTLIVFTSDHGETLFERDWVFDHGCRVYDEQVRVPLLIRFPGDRFAGSHIEAQVSHVSLFSTILDVVGIDPPGTHIGRSLLPLIEASGEGRVDRATPLFSEARLCKNRLGPLASRVGDGQLLASVRTLDFKLVEYPAVGGGQFSQLFDLEKDPREEHDRVREDPEIARNLAEALERWRKKTDRSTSDESPELTPAVKEGLRALGYAK